MNEGLDWTFLLWAIAAGVVMAVSQIYVSILLYRYEKSIGWACIGFLLILGLNVYVYQMIRLEKRAGYSFERLALQERQVWRRVYLLVLAQYLLLFVFFGWLSTPY